MSSRCHLCKLEIIKGQLTLGAHHMLYNKITFAIFFSSLGTIPVSNKHFILVSATQETIFIMPELLLCFSVLQTDITSHASVDKNITNFKIYQVEMCHIGLMFSVNLTATFRKYRLKVSEIFLVPDMKILL